MLSRRNLIGSSFAALVAFFLPKGAAAKPRSQVGGPIFPRLDPDSEVTIWKHDFGNDIVGRVQVLCLWNHEHGKGEYKIMAVARIRITGPIYARGFVFASEEEYLRRAPALAEELRNMAAHQALLIRDGRGAAYPLQQYAAGDTLNYYPLEG